MSVRSVSGPHDIPTFTTSRRVEFRDTDAAGIAHFTAFFAYMEEAEHEFLRHLGLSVHLAANHETISWPRVAAQGDFTSAVRFEDVLDVVVSVARLGEKSVTYTFTFTHAGNPVAQGSMTSVCCRLRPGVPPEPIAIPDQIRQTLASFVADKVTG